MRKILLATAAMLGATSGLASAQVWTPIPGANPAQGQTPTTPASTSSGGNTTNQYTGQPDTFHGYSNTFTGGVAPPTPGTLVIKLNGKVEVDMNAAWTSVNSSPPGAASVSAGGVVTPGTAAGNGKVNPVSFGSFFRLYPAVDGMAANGLRYGASVEIRENFPGSSAQPNVPLTPAPSASGYSSSETLFVRRAFTYLAADNVGIVRFGQTDGVIGLFDPCIFSAGCWDAGIGNFNGGMIQSQSPGAAVAIPFAWLAQAGAEYGNTKVVYLSPQFAGLDVGFQYAPSMGNGFSACSTQNGTSNANTSPGTSSNNVCNASTTGLDPTRWYNQVTVGARYQGVFGPVKMGIYAAYETAGKESGPFVAAGSLPVYAPGPTALAQATAAALHPNNYRLSAGNVFAYDNLSFVSAAAYATLTTGLGDVTASIDYIGGALNGQLAMRPQGGAPEQAIVTGLLLKNGPITLGAAIEGVDSQGSGNLTGVSQRREFGVAFGGNYNVAPGLYLVGEYMYQYRHQGDFDFANNSPGTVANGLGTRDAKAQGVMFSTVVNW